MNNISKLLVVAAISIVVTSNSRSQEITANLEWKSSYVLMDNAGLFYDDPVIQGDITAAFSNGTYACIWFSTSPDTGWGEDWGDEIDFIVGWAGDIGNGFKMNASVFYFYEPEETFPDIWYPKMTISHELFGWNVGLQAGVYMPTDGSEGGWLVGPMASKTFKVSDKVSIPVTVKFIYDDGGFGGDKGFIPSIKSGIDYSVNESLTLRMSVAGCTTIGINDARESQLVWSVGTSYKF